MTPKRALGTVVFTLVLIAGCGPKRTITNLPPGVSNAQVNAWIGASDNLHRAVSFTDAAKTGIMQARTAGVWTDDATYKAALTGVGKAFQIEIVAADALKSQPNAWGTDVTTKVSGYINEALTALAEVTTAGVAIKNPDKQAQILKLIDEARQVLQVILQLTQKPVVAPTAWNPQTGTDLMNLIFKQGDLGYVDRGYQQRYSTI